MSFFVCFANSLGGFDRVLYSTRVSFVFVRLLVLNVYMNTFTSGQHRDNQEHVTSTIVCKSPMPDNQLQIIERLHLTMKFNIVELHLPPFKFSEGALRGIFLRTSDPSDLLFPMATLFAIP